MENSSIFLVLLFFSFFLKIFSFKTSGPIDFVTHLDTAIASAECACKTTRLLKTLQYCDNLPGLMSTTMTPPPRGCALAKSSFVVGATDFKLSLCGQWYSESQSVFLQQHIVEMPQMLFVHIFLPCVPVKYYCRYSICLKWIFNHLRGPLTDVRQ